jgi:hypothetical protein
MTRSPLRILAASLLTLLPCLVQAGDFGSHAAAALDLTPDRLEAFQRTMREFSGSMDSPQALRGDLWLTSSYVTPTFFDESWEAELAAVPTDGGLRDAAWMESYLIEGRDDDFEDAAGKWLERKLKGSTMTPHGPSSGFATKLGWSDGPVVGLRHGVFTAEMRPDGWRLRLSKSFGQRGMVARAWIGEVDGDMQCRFTIGRSLFHALVR